MDLMDPMETESLGGKCYIFLAFDNYFRFSWVFFLREKSENFDVFELLFLKLQTKK